MLFSLNVAKSACNICGLSKASLKAFNISFHQLPKEERLLRQWLSALNAPPEAVLPRSFLVCGRHFLPSMFNRLGDDLRRHTLNSNAVPCLFAECDWNYMVSERNIRLLVIRIRKQRFLATVTFSNRGMNATISRALAPVRLSVDESSFIVAVIFQLFHKRLVVAR